MADLLRISLAGAMPGGEEWSVNPCYSIGGDFGDDVSAADALAIATAIGGLTLGTGITNLMNGVTTWSSVRVEARSWSGTLIAQGEFVKSTATAGSGPQNHPYQTSAVFSLRTDTPGASGRGRMYWPATGVSINSADLRIAGATNSSAVSAMKTFLSGAESAIETQLGSAATLIVWSRKNLTGYPVRSLQMGNVADVQRRRRDQLAESYAAVAYP